MLDVFFICLSIWVVSRLVDRPRSAPLWLGLGAAMGALSLTRENALALVAVAAVWSLAAGFGGKTWAGKQPAGSTIPDSGSRGLPPLAFALGLALLLLPVAGRNYAVTGGFYLTTSQFGPNFYIGNNPAADGTYMSLRPGRGAPEFERQDATELAERARQRSLTPGEVSSYWTEQALAFITSQPGDWLALVGRKIALLWNRSEMLDTESQESYEEISPVLRVLGVVGHFGVVVPLALVGLIGAWPDRRRLWPFFALLAAYAASVVLFYVFARYRFPLVPFLLLLAANGLVLAPRLFAAAISGAARPPWRRRRDRRARRELADALVHAHARDHGDEPGHRAARSLSLRRSRRRTTGKPRRCSPTTPPPTTISASRCARRGGWTMRLRRIRRA